MRWALGMIAAGCLLAAAQAGAQPAFRCGGKGKVTYSDVPCAGARAVQAQPARHTDKWQPPPQDRATVARRAPLSPPDRQECRELDATLRAQRAALKARGDAATLEEEMPLVRSQKRYRELKC